MTRPHSGISSIFCALEAVLPAESIPLGRETEAERCVLAYEQYLSEARGLAPATVLKLRAVCSRLP